MDNTNNLQVEAVVPHVKDSGPNNDHAVQSMQTGIKNDTTQIITQPTDASMKQSESDAEKFQHHLDWFLEHQAYEAACQTMRDADAWGVSPEQKLKDAKRVIREMLLKGAEDSEMSYPSLYQRSQTREEYVTRDDSGRIRTDRRSHYKYDVIGRIGLPPEELEVIVFEVQQELLASFRQTLNAYVSRYSFSRSEDQSKLYQYMWRICLLQYKFPLGNEQQLASMQAAIREIAPDLLRHNQEYFLQEIANVFNVPWYTERTQYADRALESIFTASDDEDHFPFDQALLLQENYKPPVSPQRREQALRGLWYGICRKKEAKRYAESFGITEEECRQVASERSATAINNYIAKESHYSDTRDYYRGEAVFVHQLMKDYGLSTEDIGPLKVATSELQTACLNGGFELDNGAALSAAIDRQHEGYLDQYLPDIVRSVLLRVMHNPNRSHFAAVCASLSGASQTSKIGEKICLDLVREPHEQPLLDLNQEGERKLWSKLFTGAKLELGGLVELEAFLQNASLPSDEVIAAWRAASNDSKEKNSKGVRYCDYMGTPLVFERNVESIVSLEKRYQGALGKMKVQNKKTDKRNEKISRAAYLYQNWGIRMFSRYPNEVLVRQILEDKGLLPMAPYSKTKKQNVFVLYPEHDWNGAFENPALIQDLADQADPSKYNFRIAESGRRKSCLRRIAKFCRQFGPIDMALVGGHSDGEIIEVGDDHEAISLTGVESDNEKHSLFLKHLRSYFSKNGKLIFKSCSVGSDQLENGKQGLAIRAGEMMEIATQGPVQPAYIKSIHLEKRHAEWATDKGGLALSNTYTPPKLWERIQKKFSGFFRRESSAQ